MKKEMETNVSTLSLVEQSKFGSEHAIIMDLLSQVILGILSIFLIFIGTLGNAVICYLVLRKPSMRSAINILLSTIAICDCCLMTMCLPFNLTTLLVHRWVFGSIFCQLHSYIQSLLFVEISLILTVISIDRYFIIVRHHDRLNARRAKLIILATTVFAAIVNIPGTLRRPGFTLTNYSTQCELKLVQDLPEYLYILTRFALMFVVPFLTISWAFYYIIWTVRNRSLRISSYPSAVGNFPQKHPARRYLIGSASRRSQYVVVVDMRFKARTFSTILILFLAFVICRVPYAIADLAMALADSSTLQAKTYLLWWVYLNSALNPVIYAWKIRKYREAFYKWMPQWFNDCLDLNPPSQKIQPFIIHPMEGSYHSMEFSSSVI